METAAAGTAANQPAGSRLPGADRYLPEQRLAEKLRILLGIPTRWDLDGFLKEHQVEKYTAEDFEHDLATIREFREQ